jgi:hypothetical protein
MCTGVVHSYAAAIFVLKDPRTRDEGSLMSTKEKDRARTTV